MDASERSEKFREIQHRGSFHHSKDSLGLKNNN